MEIYKYTGENTRKINQFIFYSIIMNENTSSNNYLNSKFKLSSCRTLKFIPTQFSEISG